MISKKDIVTAIAKKLNMPKKNVDSVVTQFLAEIIIATKNGEEVHLQDFGKFCQKYKNGKTYYNPKNKILYDVPARVVPYFKYSAFFRDVVNGEELKSVQSKEN